MLRNQKRSLCSMCSRSLGDRLRHLPKEDGADVANGDEQLVVGVDAQPLDGAAVPDAHMSNQSLVVSPELYSLMNDA